MSKSVFTLRLIVMAAIVLCIVASMAGASGEQEKTASAGLKIATVDPDRVADEYKYMLTQRQQITRAASDENLTLRAWKQNPLLAEADQQALAALLVKQAAPAGLTPADKTSLDKLQAASKQLSDENSSLQSKTYGSLTQQDRDKLTDYTRRVTETDQRCSTRQEADNESFKKQVDDATQKTVKDVREGIGRVAKEKGYNLVFSSQVVWYAETDLTDSVVAVLNK